MDLPKPPQEIELRNIIDKLAQFVARNGPEFELMTKNKQKGNPKFSFLFGGEHFNYYQYKVTTEQAILKQKASRESTSQPGQLSNHLPTHSGQINNQIPTQLSGQIGNPVAPQIGTMGGQLATQISTQIPSNLPNQWTSTSPHQNLQSLETVRTQQAQLQEQIGQSELNLTAHHSVLMQQQRAQIDEALAKVQSDTLTCDAQELRINLNELDNLLQPIMDSCTKDSISTGKGWILHHCTSPQTNSLIARYLLKKVLNSTLFTQKLHIVYLVNDVLHHCVRKSADQLKCALESVVIPMFCQTSISANDEQQAKLNKLLSLWESKNNYFDSSVLEKLRQPAHSWSEYQANLITSHASVITPITTATKMALEGFQAQHQAFVQHAMQQIQALEQQKQTLEAQASQVVQASQPPPNQPITSAPPPPMGTVPDGLTAHPPPIGSEITQPPPDINFSQPPPGYPPTPFIPGVELPDFSKPPPGFPATNPDELVPGVPYYDLPAGLMVPLIKLEDAEYKPLDPDCIRLPPPAPPTDRLLAAMEAFYAPPCHDRPRDSEGWEKLGLYEYYRAKNSARKKKEEDILSGLRLKSRSPSPIVRTRSKSRSPPRKRYRSETPPPKRPTNANEFEEKSRSPQPASAAPIATIDAHSPGTAASSNIPEESEENEPNVTTLPQLLEPPDKLLDEKNKGHQMLRKMGWSGAGLGAKEQGIEQPISGGEVRDRVDMFKGLGVNLSDPYENFRKSKGQAFINRMKARAEERL